MPDSSRLVDNFGSRISVQPFSSQVPEDEVAVGRILSYLYSFNSEIAKVREDIDLSEALEATDSPSIDKFREYLHTLSKDQRTTLSIEARRICERYRLSENWEIPVQIAVLTHRLYVPKDDEVRIRVPQNSYLADVLTDLYEEAPIPSKYPAIYPVYKVSLRELKAFIDTNSHLISQAMSRLPQKPRSSAARHTMSRGRLVWLLKQEHSNWTYDRVAAELNRLLGLRRNQVMDRNDARNVHQAFLREIQSLDSA